MVTTSSPPSAPAPAEPAASEYSPTSIPFPERDETCPPELYEARRNQLWLMKQRRVFKADNELSRDAKYPLSKKNHFAWLVALLLLESALNAYFFSRGSTMGLMGGWMQAALLAAANVGGAAALGYFGMREINHIEPTRKLLGQFSIALYVVAALSLNLVAAHYRDSLESAGGAALATATHSAWWSFVGLSFDSMLLFTLGMISSALGAHSGYKGDDAYPGYGEIDRECAEAKEAFIELRKLTPRAVTPYPHVGDQ